MLSFIVKVLSLGGLLSFNLYGRVNLAVTVLLLYYTNERSVLHREITEMIFWACMYGWFGFIFIGLHDSPLMQLGEIKSVFGCLADIIIVLVFSLFGIWAHTSAQTERLQSSIQELDLQMLVEKPYGETGAARFTVYCIQNLISHRGTSSGQLQRLLGRLQEVLTGKMHWLEEEVLQALESCCHRTDPKDPPEDLLYVLNCSEVDLPQFLALAGSEAVLKILRDNIRHMDTVTKTRLVDALQRQHDFYVMRLQQEVVVELLESTTGDELRMMKDVLDEGGDFYNLHKLVFHDLDPDMYQRALSHIQKEGRRMAGQYDKRQAPIKIISDVDDTLYGSGGHFPAGCDERFPKSQVYPGVLALFKEITAERAMRQKDKAPKGEEEENEQNSSFSVLRLLGYRVHNTTNPVWVRVPGRQWKEISVSDSETVAQLQERVARVRDTGHLSLVGEGDVCFHPPQLRVWSNLVFLSARPHAYKDYLESKSYQLFRRLRKSGKMHCMPTLLAGKLKSSGTAFMFGVVLLYPRNTLVGSLFQVILCYGCLGLLPLVLNATFLAIAAVLIWFYVAARKESQSRVCDVWRPVGEDKIKSFVQYRQLYSECATLFFGDNGQGDLMCAERLTGMNNTECPEDAGVGGVVTAAFIHQVADPTDQLSELFEQLDETSNLEEEYQKRGIYFFRTYVGAAIHAFNLNLVSEEGLYRVGTEAVQDMVRLRIRYLGRAERRPWKDVVNEMNADVDRANSLLAPKYQIEKVPSSAATNLDLERAKAAQAKVGEELPLEAKPPKVSRPLDDMLPSIEEKRVEETKSLEEGKTDSDRSDDAKSEDGKSEEGQVSQTNSEKEPKEGETKDDLAKRLKSRFDATRCAKRGGRQKNKAIPSERPSMMLSHCPSLGDFSFTTVPPIGRC